MPSALYTRDILRLAASIPHQQRLDSPDASAECRSPVCGSRVAVDVVLAPDGRIARLGIETQACALGQASAALLGHHAIGRSAEELEAATAALRAYLADPAGSAETPFWPGLSIFAEARAYPARHPSIMLAFEAASRATRHAGAAPSTLREAEA